MTVTEGGMIILFIIVTAGGWMVFMFGMMYLQCCSSSSDLSENELISVMFLTELTGVTDMQVF